MDRFTEVQLFANRGYAVLKVNFRGSSGYGKRFLSAGFKQNGLDVQSDITDGIYHLIDRKIADKDRIAIVGGSYGGYAVLAGLAFTPELYACGVDLFGVSSFFTFLQNLPPWANKEPLYQTIGHPEHDRDLLTRTSPLFHVENIKAPILISQGGKDPIVNKAESEQMVAALRERNMDVQYIYKENEGHGYFRDEQNWRELWEAMDLFLAKHLKD
jgi:dipeptidyl aminopeptidase/acylaminoacyl peptidase